MQTKKPSKKTRKEIRNKQKKMFLFVFLVIFIFFDFVWIMNHDYFKVDLIHLSGNKTIISEEINTVLGAHLGSKTLGLFPRNNILLLNTRSIENKIKNSFPKIYNANVIVDNGSDLLVDVEEREPHSLWCKNENYESDFDEECYFADQRGFIYTQAPYFSSGVFEKIYTTNDLLQIGGQVLNKDDFSDFFMFTESLHDDYGIAVDRVFVGDRDETRIYINSLLKSNFFYKPYVVYKQSDSYELIHRNIGLMIEHELFTEEFSEYPERLEFIDVRIIDQIRYKFTPLEEFLIREKTNNETQTETNE